MTPVATKLLEAFNGIPDQRARQALLALAREMAVASPSDTVEGA